MKRMDVKKIIDYIYRNVIDKCLDNITNPKPDKDPFSSTYTHEIFYNILMTIVTTTAPHLIAPVTTEHYFDYLLFEIFLDCCNSISIHNEKRSFNEMAMKIKRELYFSDTQIDVSTIKEKYVYFWYNHIKHMNRAKKKGKDSVPLRQLDFADIKMNRLYETFILSCYKIKYLDKFYNSSCKKMADDLFSSKISVSDEEILFSRIIREMKNLGETPDVILFFPILHERFTMTNSIADMLHYYCCSADSLIKKGVHYDINDQSHTFKVFFDQGFPSYLNDFFRTIQKNINRKLRLTENKKKKIKYSISNEIATHFHEQDILMFLESE